tara:strand:- start:17098 stop:18333 length:1236 start_codon:yes stop_codon:yes gene_type:complete
MNSLKDENNDIKKQKLLPVIYQSLGRISVQVLGFFLGVLIVRYSGLDLFGEYAKYNALINISFGVFASGIYSNYLRSNNIKLLWDSLAGTTYLLVFFLVFIYPIYTFLFEESYFNIMLILLGVYFMRLCELYIISIRFIEQDAKAILPRAIPYLILITLFLIFKPDDITSLLLMFVIAWMTIVFYVLSLKGYFVVQKLNIKLLLSSTFLLSINTLGTQITGNFDQLMISGLLGDTQLGVYKIGLSFAFLVMPVITVFSFIYLSKLKEKLQNDSVQLIKKSFYSQIGINLCAGLIFLIFYSIFLVDIIDFIYGLNDENAYYAGVILAIGVLFNVIAIVFSYTFLAVKKDKEVLFITLIGATTNIVLNYFFITSYGILGAAWASVITQFLMLVLYMYIFYFKMDSFNSLKKLI